MDSMLNKEYMKKKLKQIKFFFATKKLKTRRNDPAFSQFQGT
jgi:hypothetical protein